MMSYDGVFFEKCVCVRACVCVCVSACGAFLFVDQGGLPAGKAVVLSLQATPIHLFLGQKIFECLDSGMQELNTIIVRTLAMDQIDQPQNGWLPTQTYSN